MLRVQVVWLTLSNPCHQMDPAAPDAGRSEVHASSADVSNVRARSTESLALPAQHCD